jgi:hypothetical protein
VTACLVAERLQGAAAEGGEWPTVDGAFARRAEEEAVTRLSSETVVRLLSSSQNRHRFSASHKRNLGKVGHSSRSAPSFDQDALSRYYLCTASTVRVRAYDAHADRSQSPSIGCLRLAITWSLGAKETQMR